MSDEVTLPPALVETLDDAPEAFRPYYREVTDEKSDDRGKFAFGLTSVGGWRLEDVGKLKGGLIGEREKVSGLEAKLKEFDGLDVAAARDAMSKVDEMSKWTPAEKVQGQINVAVQKIKDDHQKELDGRDDTIRAREEAVRTLAIEAKAAAAIAKLKGNADLLMPHVLASAEVRYAEGQSLPQVFIKGADGKTPLPTTGSGTDPMQVEEFVEKVLLERYPMAFDGHGGTGSGATGGSSTAPSGGGGASHVISAEDAKDPVRYRAAKEAARKAGKQLEMVR